MSHNNDILNTLNLKDENIIFEENCLTEERIHDVSAKVYHAKLTGTPTCCAHCGCLNEKETSIIKYGSKTVLIKLLPVSGSPAYLRLKKQRYLCRHCGKTFIEQTPVVEANCCIANNVKIKTAIALTHNTSQKDIAREYNISTNTVGRILDNAFSAYQPSYDWLPQALCFDEFKSVKSAKGNMSFIFCNAYTSEIIDILEDRRFNCLKTYFMKFKRKARLNVKHIVIDIYKPYMKLIQECFPNAQIIIDRFHLVQLFSRELNKIRINTMNKDKANESKYKRFWRLFLQPTEKVDHTHCFYQPTYKAHKTNRQILEDLLSKDSVLRAAYDVYQSVLYAINHNSMTLIEQVLTNQSNELHEKMQKALRTLKNYQDYVKNTLACSLNNGRIEGLNNKIKAIKRVAFGFRSFYHFRNRILIQQGILKLKAA